MSESFDPYSTASLYTDASTGQLKERSYRIRIVGGPDKGKESVIEVGTLMVGTHPNNDMVITDDTVSRYHLELQHRSEGLQVQDLSTTNGTFHGDTRLGEIFIQGASRLRLGKNTHMEIIPLDRSIEVGQFEGTQFGVAVGTSQVMQSLFALLSRVAPTDATLLLEGETGTGKEAIAESVHRKSSRAGKAFVVVDCGAIPSNLIASELFGHVRGSFTGANSDKEGLIRAADGGTLFLDEIGELALDLQPQLLRALEKREVRPVGDSKSIEVDIRVIAATNRNLKDMVREGTFREDLYYRLAVVKAVVPPLRERTGDIPLLAHHFADRLGFDYNLSPSLLESLKAHQWPGNVRELRNVVERALSLGHTGGLPSAGDLVTSLPSEDDSMDASLRGHGPEVFELPFKEAKGQLIESFERDYLDHLLKKHRGNISRAAADAGIDRNYIHRLVKKYGIVVERG
jgi:transcriptional regulator with PAS, ATPase and Fis domain